MSAEQELLTHWRSLPQDKQEEVLDFVEFLHLKSKSKNNSKIQHNTPEGKGWPPGFFEKTYGSCQDDPIVIDYEGDFEEREEIV
ncbi:MAG: DUF2281 domain-containing protein [Nostoc sp.]|uniref:DUF2281 domain-containing protein n=1 Tax=Nostoc sp. TaxID=1180 RepID=UPI002FEFA5B6